MVQFYFKRIIEKIKFNFVPVYDIQDNSIYGYKIIKDFTAVGFDDKEIMYQLAFEEDIFETLILKILEKSYQLAIEKGYGNKKLFFTIRLNYILDWGLFLERVHTIAHALKLSEENLFFDIKGVKDWEKLYCEADNCNFNFKKIYKEDKNTPLNLNNINACNPELLELKDIDAFLVIREFLNENIKFIFKRNNNPDLTIEELKKLGFDYYYVNNSSKMKIEEDSENN